MPGMDHFSRSPVRTGCEIRQAWATWTNFIVSEFLKLVNI